MNNRLQAGTRCLVRPTIITTLIAAGVWGRSGEARGAIHVVDLGTAAPPGVVGGYTMTPFGDNPSTGFTPTTSIGPATGAPFDTLTFDHTVYAADEPSWGSWSHGYQGDIYFNDVSGIFGQPQNSTLTIILPASTGAFYFYGEPLGLSTFAMTAIANDGSSLTSNVVGLSGAHGWGFYMDGAPGPALMSISITCTDPGGYAVGEFGIAAQVPAPGAALTCVFGIGFAGSRRRR